MSVDAGPRTVALEGHFWIPELAAVAGMGLVTPAGSLGDLELRDLGGGRVAAMDAAGIDVQVLSHAAPGAQHLPPAPSRRLTRRANDVLAAAVQARPDRFAGFATLPLADPAAAADELERCVIDLGFVGAMVNSTFATTGRFLDDPAFGPVLDRVAQLGVPLYLHPSPPTDAVRATYGAGLPETSSWLLTSSAWGFHAETGLQVLRLVLAGVFERYPGLRVIVGHGGEMLPFMLDRIDRILTPAATGLAAPPSHYLLRHVWITTSGLFSRAPLMCALEVLGPERVLFSVDYPYSPNAAGRAALDALPLEETVRAQVAGGNAVALLGL